MSSLSSGILDSFHSLQEQTATHWRASVPTRGTPAPPGVASLGVSADHHLADESRYWYLVELARYFWDNDPIYQAAITRIADNVIGCGYRVDPSTGFGDVDDYLLADWERYAKGESDSDVAQEHNLHARAYIEFCSVLNDGDIFNVPRSSGAIQTLESHRCRSSRGSAKDVVLGIEQDDQARRTHYWFTRTDTPLGYSPRYSEIERVVARDSRGNRRVWHYYLPRRMSQRRGVPVIAPVAEFVQMHNDIQYAKLFQQQAVSAVALFHEMPLEAFQNMNADEQDLATDLMANTAGRPEWQLKAGLDYWARFPGEKLQGFSPNIPNPEYFQHVTMILGIIAVNLGLPLAVLMLDPSQTNFSGWRGAVDQARRGFERLQDSFGKRWYADKYTWHVRMLAAGDARFQRLLQSSGVNPAEVVRERDHAVLGHTVHAPRWKYIQPVEDIKARVDELRNGLISPVADANQHGRDYYQTVEETIAARDFALRAAAEAAERFASDYPDLEQPPRWYHWFPAMTTDNVRFQQSVSETESETKTLDTTQGAPE